MSVCRQDRVVLRRAGVVVVVVVGRDGVNAKIDKAVLVVVVVVVDVVVVVVVVM